MGVTLFDTFSSLRGQDEDIEKILSRDAAGKVVVYSWNMHPQLVDDALSKGCSGYLSKKLNAQELVEVLQRINQGEIVVSPTSGDPDRNTITGENTELTWPGIHKGLSPRESETIIMIV